jgi:general secretion pathway protein G
MRLLAIMAAHQSYLPVRVRRLNLRKTQWLDAPWSASRSDRGCGFTLPEFLVAIAIGAVLTAIAIPTYTSYIDRVKVTRAIADIGVMSGQIQRYYSTYSSIPSDLSAIGWNGVLDPCGNPYQYLNFQGLHGKGKMRKDKNLVPINTQYDLYSMGADGQSVPPLTAKVSHDDVILANDGNYIGLASAY